MRPSCSSSVAPQPCSSGSVPSSAGVPERASTACSAPFSIAKIVLPSVLTMSGSSTPASSTVPLILPITLV